MNQSVWRRLTVSLVLLCAVAIHAADQVWIDGAPDNVWSTNAPNWEAGALWTNDNSAVFWGGGTLAGETVDTSNDVRVANITFQTNGYVIADAENNGTLTFVGAPSVVTVNPVGSTGTISEVIAGSGGLTKAGNGTLSMTATNTFAGQVVVSNGVLRLSRGALYALGQGGAGNDTIVRDGATLDFNGSYTNAFKTVESFQIAGSGVDGRGALINTGYNFMNGGFSNLTLLGNSTIGCIGTSMGRIDLYFPVAGNGYTLTKFGDAELAVGTAVTNCRIVVNGGNYTYMNAGALGGADFDTTVNWGSGNLRSYGNYTVTERLFFNGGKITAAGYGTTLFNIAGRVTLNSNVLVTAGVDRNPGNSNIGMLELSGLMEGAGGIQRSAGGGTNFVYVTCDTNTYSGPTTIDSGSTLLVGKTNLYSGVLGVGVVTNSGILYGYSSRICQSNLVNYGSLYVNTGVLGAVSTVSSGNLYLNGGSLGSGTVVNSGSLYANSAVLGTGEVVNNAGGSLYLNPANLSAGRIVNAGTVYGTSVVQAASSVVNSGTWQCYSGSFGSSIVTNASAGTLNLYTNVFTYGQFVNSGTLNLLNPMTLPGAMTVNGGTVNFGVMSNTLVLAGPLTVNSIFSLNSALASVIELSGKISGPGGLTRSGDGLCFVTSDLNDYTGPTTVNGGRSLWVGKPAGEAAGRLGSGAITNNGSLYFDSVGAYTNFNGINGSGMTAIRYGGQVILSGGVSTNGDVHVANGSLTLTNGAIFSAYNQLTIANRADVRYVVAPTNCLLLTNVLATVTVNSGCSLIVKSVTFGNGNDLPGGTMTGILNQVGGVVRTTGMSAEDNGVRLAHYPQARSVYNMMGGALYVDGNWELGCATDGQGWFNMTGGEVFTKRVMLNERIGNSGYGRLTVAGGTLNVGSLTGSTLSISNGIAADEGAPYLVAFGGAGGVIRAVTNIEVSVSNVLFGEGVNAITFDTQGWTITMTNRISGTGGLNKTGTGALVLSGNNTYGGATRILQGSLTPASATALPAGGQVLFGVAANDAGGRLVASGDLSLAGLTVGVANPESLDKTKAYTIATYSGALTGRFSADTLPDPWYAYYDWEHKSVQLRAGIGTLIRVR